jgi:hypothetical protein
MWVLNAMIANATGYMETGRIFNLLFALGCFCILQYQFAESTPATSSKLRAAIAATCPL